MNGLEYQTELVLGLLAIMVVLVTLARRLELPYPILLVVGGLALSLMPNLPRIHLAPEIVFLLFLPPLLYEESYFTSWRDLRANLRPISLLAFGLVLVTTALVGVVAHWAIPALSWPVAFVLGAVVAPTDEAAVMPVIERLGVPRRVATIISDESLVNDAVSLVIYRMAAAAVVSGSFSLMQAGSQFLLVSAGGVAIGLAFGWLIARLMRKIDDPPVEITVSLLIPFVTYLAAEKLGASGVLAVVALGIYMGRQGSLVRTPQTRVEARAFWQTLVFLLNGLLFLLVGLQLRSVLDTLSSIPLWVQVGNALLISLTCVLVRIAWVFASVYAPRALSRKLRKHDPAPSWQNVMIIAWTGIRGGLSLAAALAIPLTLGSGTPFPQREQIIFLTYTVILTTLVLQGLTLPFLIRYLRVKRDGSRAQEENTARLTATKAALSRLEALSGEDWVPSGVAGHLREHYMEKLRLLEGREDGSADSAFEEKTAAYSRLQQALLAAEHKTVVRLRDEGVIEDEVLHVIERDLDLERIRLKTREEGD
ncbi:MAG TPA: Na+/H+ antiporter [Chthonomonadaceae bacterium]|nr:Na+/H+ antiporter [Chthonomonadaceae bacterium]